MEKKETTAISLGVIIALMLMVLTLVLYFTGLYTKQWTQFIAFVILVGGIIYAVVNNGKENENRKTFGALFGFGFKVTGVITCLMILYTILSGFVFPGAKDKIIEMAREQALRQPGANEAQVEMGMKMFADHYTLFIVMGILFWYLVLGALSSLVGAAVTRKKTSEQFR